MTHWTFQLQADDDDMYMMLPNDFIGDGDPGEPLAEGMNIILRAWAKLGYWPVDFGEGDEHHTMLWMSRRPCALGAVEMTENFIRSGGAV